MFPSKYLLHITNVCRNRAPTRKQKLPHRSPLLLFYRGTVHEVSQAGFQHNLMRGIDYIRDARLNKGLAFSLEERQALGIHGLYAPCFKSQEEQLEICKVSIDRYKNNLNKYLYLAELNDMNQKLFFCLLDTDIEKYLPIVYTPTVGLVCQKYGLVYRRPRGLFICINDKGHILDVLRNWPVSDVKAIVFTDGERILGLGDLGAYGMGIPVGKLALYTALAGISPRTCLPVMLDVGTDNENLITDPLYIGLRHKRVRGKVYEEFMDEFMLACTQLYGPNVLLQFEDFALPNAAPLLKKYRNNYCTFNDDIQGTASVAVSGLLAASRLTKKKISENIYLFLGAGSAANGIANLTVYAMTQEGLTEQQARDRIYMFDIEGLVTSKRKGGVPQHVKNYGKDVEPELNLEKAVATLKPTVLIGCSTVAGAFTPGILRIMAQNNERPVVFALSNPTSNAECTAQMAYDMTDGRVIFASGSPFPPVQYQGKTYYTGQGNNSYIFPGVAMAVLATNTYRIPDEVFLVAAQSLARFVSDDDLEHGRIYPPLADLKKLSFQIAKDVAQLAYETDLATFYPRPADLDKFITSQIYNLKYKSYIPSHYAFPKEPDVKLKTVDDAYNENVADQKAGAIHGK